MKQCIDTQNSDKHREPEETIWQTLNPQNNNNKKKKDLKKPLIPNPQTEKPNPKKSSDI